VIFALVVPFAMMIYNIYVNFISVGNSKREAEKCSHGIAYNQMPLLFQSDGKMEKTRRLRHNLSHQILCMFWRG